MNKKFFAALASAAMFLNTVAPVFAEEFTEVETGVSGDLTGVASLTVALDSKNFRDSNLLTAI